MSRKDGSFGAAERPMMWRHLLEDLFCYIDSCNVYLLRCGERAVVVDFGSGAWCDHLRQVGVAGVDDVVLTHAHRDPCCGLYRASRTCVPALAHAQVLAPTASAAGDLSGCVPWPLRGARAAR